ncbi:Alpha/Beta hydrolase protein [Dactylonectria macrodidyma]|uniref:Alpha/Beta hydrolase protein n=1 Tax=Dactylonectria macrodidyma TaxID=307937 RepID=A0A9P9EZF0_9HYPO|nr:Alpha/Beta hydrolase protein [Dactylonectria macrodidyma]
MVDTYATKGLPAPPEVSMTTMPMAGLLVDVYGLDELPAGSTVSAVAPAPVTCLWLLHPRTRTRARMRDIALRTVAAWHAHPGASARGLVALAFDMPNHGSRLVSETANLAWDGGNASHALDMLGMVKGGCADMRGLMDLVAGYLGRDVDAHMCLGWSLGGHSAWQAWVGEERIDAAVAVVGCPDFMGLMEDRASSTGLEYGASFLGSKYFPPDVVATCLAQDPKAVLFGTSAVPPAPLMTSERSRLRPLLDSRVRGKRLLLCSGAEDTLVPYANGKPVIDALKDAVGDEAGWYREGRVVLEDRVYEGVGHRFSKDMVLDAVRFLVDAVEAGPRGRREEKL